MSLELALVMPVYNEQACIAGVVRSWREMLDGMGIRYRMLVLDDGSTDGTGAVLDAFAAEDGVEVIHKPNSGHGPTILRGYRRAVCLADWVFQCDSDDEMKPEAFPALWAMREQYDALFGVRAGRKQGAARRLISACSRLTVRMLFGRGVEDVNTPYRLIRSRALAKIIERVPDDTFAPNVIVSGALCRAGAKIYNHPVPHECRSTGNVSIVKWKLWRAALTSFWQTLRCRPRIILESPRPTLAGKAPTTPHTRPRRPSLPADRFHRRSQAP